MALAQNGEYSVNLQGNTYCGLPYVGANKDSHISQDHFLVGSIV